MNNNSVSQTICIISIPESEEIPILTAVYAVEFITNSTTFEQSMKNLFNFLGVNFITTFLKEGNY